MADSEFNDLVKRIEELERQLKLGVGAYTKEQLQKALETSWLPDADTFLLRKSVGSDSLEDDSITAEKIAPDAVGSSEIAAGAVGGSELASDATDGWITLFSSNGLIGPGPAADYYWLAGGGSGAPSAWDATAATGGAAGQPPVFWFLWSEYAITGKTLQIRMNGTLSTGGTSPGGITGSVGVGRPTGQTNVATGAPQWIIATDLVAVAQSGLVAGQFYQCLSNPIAVTDATYDGFMAPYIRAHTNAAASSFLGGSVAFQYRNV